MQTTMGILQPLTVDNAAQYLTEMAFKFLPMPIARVIHEHIIMDDAFNEAPGGSSHHHDYRHGLRLHTAEVLQYALDMMGGDSLNTRKPLCTSLDERVVVTAAIWHDFNKTREYAIAQQPFKDIMTSERIVAFDFRDSPATEAYAAVQVHGVMDHIKKKPYMQLIGHPVGSALDFWQAMHGVSVPSAEWMEKVIHCILAHHGRREWGAPVEPHTPEAWILHAADMLSSHPLYKD